MYIYFTIRKRIKHHIYGTIKVFCQADLFFHDLV
jgi:hypothetical protein